MTLRRLALALLVSTLLTSCGGGTTVVASPGTGGTGITWGTITGFGSVFIDGTEYDDSSAAIEQGDASGQAIDALVALGQRVQVRHDGAGVATAIHVVPQLVGPITASTANTLSLMGQTVQWSAVDTVTDGTPSGFAKVFGQWTQDNQGQPVLSATRIEYLANTPSTPILIGGTIASWTDRTVTLNNGPSAGQTWTITLPANASTASLNPGVDAEVAFWIDNTSGTAWQESALTALATDSHPPAFNDGDELTIHAMVANGAQRAMGIKLPPPPTGTELNGRAELKLRKVNGVWTWAQTPVNAPALSAVDITGWVNTAAPDWSWNTFTLRNTTLRVDDTVLNAATVDCRTTSNAAVRVHVVAERGTSPLKVTHIDCSASITANDVHAASTNASYNPDTREIRVTVDGQTYAYTLPPDRQAPNALANIPVNVELRRNDRGVVQVQRITLKKH